MQQVVVAQHTVLVHNTRTIAIVCDDGSMASCEAPRLRAPRSVPRWWPSPTSRPSPPASPRAHAPRSAPPPAARPARTPSTCGRAWPIVNLGHHHGSQRAACAATATAAAAAATGNTGNSAPTDTTDTTVTAAATDTTGNAMRRTSPRRRSAPRPASRRRCRGAAAAAQWRTRTAGVSDRTPTRRCQRWSQPAHSPGTPASSCRESGSRTGPRSAAPPADWPPSAAPHQPSSATPCTHHALCVRAAHLAPADGDAPCQALALQPRAHAGQASGTRDHAWQPQGRRRRHTCTAKGLVGLHRSSSACPGVSILNIS
jgi:hypothetical protein